MRRNRWLFAVLLYFGYVLELTLFSRLANVILEGNREIRLSVGTDSYEVLQEIDHIARMSKVSPFSLSVKMDERTVKVTGYAQSEEFRDYEVVLGDNYSDNTILVNENLFRSLNLDSKDMSSLSEKLILLKGQRTEIITRISGVCSDGKAIPTVYLSLRIGAELTGYSASNIAVIVDKADNYGLVTDELSKRNIIILEDDSKGIEASKEMRRSLIISIVLIETAVFWMIYASTVQRESLKKENLIGCIVCLLFCLLLRIPLIGGYFEAKGIPEWNWYIPALAALFLIRTLEILVTGRFTGDRSRTAENR